MSRQSRRGPIAAKPQTVRKRAMRRRWRRAQRANMTRGPQLRGEPRLPRWLKRQLRGG